ncbi:aldo/keto reductase [Aestuariimicrobium kwangyangense]|uniref:aldo/keto reductase n=1 Tax=Aestuariimicrobium kwangyangense TaxID=396389 RepID=UPI0003B34627|nr:aldo/keto reductase [Aestuariimicrobium kwangyangense]
MTDPVPAPFPSPTVRLSSGGALPQFGFGTYKVPADETEALVRTALEVGHRHLDTATMYGNERGVGRALAASGLPRDDVFVTTKLDNPDHEPAAARAAFARSLDLLGLEWVDLYLIHWPMPRTTDFVATWRTLTEFVQDGRARAIGVSNFQPDQLRAIIDATGVVPAVNQIEVTPYLTQEPLRALHAELGIVTEAWSPLARGRVLTEPVVVDAARRLGCTPAQLVLAWHLQRGDVVFPKSSTRERMRENAGALDLVRSGQVDEATMAAISGLNRDRRVGSSPDAVELDVQR